MGKSEKRPDYVWRDKVDGNLYRRVLVEEVPIGKEFWNIHAADRKWYVRLPDEPGSEAFGTPKEGDGAGISRKGFARGWWVSVPYVEEEKEEWRNVKLGDLPIGGLANFDKLPVLNDRCYVRVKEAGDNTLCKRAVAEKKECVWLVRHNRCTGPDHPGETYGSPLEYQVSYLVGSENKWSAAAKEEDESVGARKVKASTKGWEVGQLVKWHTDVPKEGAHETGTVIGVDDKAVTIKWDTGRTDGYYVDARGNLYWHPEGELDEDDLNKDFIVGEHEGAARARKVAAETTSEETTEMSETQGATSKKVKVGAAAKSGVKDVDIVRTGHQIILPPGMSFDEAITWLERKKEADEKEISVFEIVDVYPLEGAYAFKRAIEEKYGFAALEDTPGFFGPNPPTMIGLEVGPGVTVQVPWGRIGIPGLAGFFQTGLTVKDGLMKFSVQGKTKQKHNEDVREIVDLTKKIAQEQSIYRGKAIRIEFCPEGKAQESPLDYLPQFMDLTHVKEEHLIFSDKVANLVETAIFTPLKKADRCVAEGVPFKRGIVLEGPWGTGKTLTANVVAKIATENGTTFMYLKDVRQLEQALRFARMLGGRVVIFGEDIDQIGRDDRTKQGSPLNDLLNTIDGVDMKSVEVMTILTTNYINDIEQGFLRPGRVDAVIPVRPPDAAAAVRLVRLYAHGQLAAGIDFQEVGRKLDGQIPAVIGEVVKRAKLEAIGHTDDEHPLLLTQTDLERAADSMLTHLKLLEPRVKDERTPVEKAAATLAEAVKVAKEGKGQLVH